MSDYLSDTEIIDFCENGTCTRIFWVQRAINKGYITTEKAFESSLEDPMLDYLRVLYRYTGNFDKDIKQLYDIFINGKFEIYYKVLKVSDKYIQQKFARSVASENYIRFAEYLVENNIGTYNDILSGSISSGNISSINYILSKGTSIEPYHFNIPAEKGDLDTFKFLYSLNPLEKINYVTVSAASGGNLDLVKYIIEKNLDDYIGVSLYSSTNLQITKYLLSIYSFDQNDIILAYSSYIGSKKNPDISNFLFSLIDPIDDIYAESDNIIINNPSLLKAEENESMVTKIIKFSDINGKLRVLKNLYAVEIDGEEEEVEELINDIKKKISEELDLLTLLRSNKYLERHIYDICPFKFENSQGIPVLCMDFYPYILDHLVIRSYSIRDIKILGCNLLKILYHYYETTMKYHSDIKPENIAMRDTDISNINNIVLIDLEQPTSMGTKTRLNTPDYCSHNINIKIFDFGIRNDWEGVIYIIANFLMLKLPWNGKTNKSELKYNFLSDPESFGLIGESSDLIRGYFDILSTYIPDNYPSDKDTVSYQKKMTASVLDMTEMLISYLCESI